MPHINRIRVNNVKYNFGTQFYDDFSMRFDGKNALYDLANGGGKSVLMLLLFQNLIPNCTLDEKQPVEKLFRTSDGSTSIHSLVEWKLDEPDIEDGYKYMLTGFCARKAKEDDAKESSRGTSAAIDYFNYVIFYRGYNDNDIINLPLSSGNEHMTYTGLRSYLKTLSHSDYQLKIFAFDRKGEYQRFISGYGLYESQWEIIRGINKTEGHVRTYFESNYRTTRRVIEDLLIEEVIQKAFIHKAGGDDSDMAETLLGIKDKLLELSKKRETIGDYDGQIEALRTFGSRIESLGELYDEEESYKKELVKVFNTLKLALHSKQNAMELSKKEEALAKKRLLETHRRLDTAKVQKNRAILKSLENDGDKDDANIKQLEAAYSEKLYELSKAQCINDYLDYKDNEKEILIIKEALEGSTKNYSHVTEDMRSLAAEAKCLIRAGQQQFLGQLSELEDCRREKQTKSDAEAASIHETDRQLAVLDFDIDSAKKEKKELQKALADLRGELQELLAEGTDEELKRYEAVYDEVCRRLSLAKKEAERERQLLEIYKNDLNQIEADTKILEAKKLQAETFFTQYEQQKISAEHLASVYGVSGSEPLRIAIEARYKKAAADIYIHSSRRDAMEAYSTQLEEQNPSVTSGDVAEVMDYLRRTCGVRCISGSDYLKNTGEDRCMEVLCRLPFLPYAVIVQEGFHTLLQNEGFLRKYFADHTIPVVSMQIITDGEGNAFEDGILFTGDKRHLYADSDALLKEKQRAEENLAQEKKALLRLLDQQETYMADLEQICYFMRYYEKDYLEQLADFDAIDRKLEENRKKISGLYEKIENTKMHIQAAETSIKAIQDEEKKAGHQCAVSRQMIGLRMEFDKVSERQEESERLKHDLVTERQLYQSEVRNLAGEMDALKDGIRGVRNELAVLQAMWDADFLAYDDGKDAVPVDFDRTRLEAVHVRFMGLKQTYEAGSSEMTDKRKLLENCERTGQRLKEAIAMRNISFDDLAATAQIRPMSRMDAVALETLKSAADRLAGEIKLAQAMAADRRANRHRLTGSVENAIQVIEERYGVYKEVDLNGADFDIFVEEASQFLETLKQKAAEAQKNKETVQEQLRQLDDMKKEVERLARMAGADMALTGESYMPDMDFRKKTEQLRMKYEQLRKTEDFKKAEFEKGRDKLIENLAQYHADELAFEVRNHIKLPSLSREAEQLRAHTEETIRIIMLEKDRILTGLESMVKIKENFVSQCIQRCMDIKTALEQLPKMSKITLDNEQIQMIRLQIPYVKEEYYEQRMSDYVDNVAKAADDYKDGQERLKYIRAKLSWKQLFSVIVTDMNAVRLSLYKRERIREQSRFLRYEEAVGSTGQSQGIYIQFLIAVINYISALNSKAVDAASLKKVIFIDNPFGAAKDIYIWEPIFALLRENNVQLIVPARGATPAITGKFDVNYILGQKLVGSRQQTVVVDYYSNIAAEDVEYRRIEFEQEVFDFV